MANENRYAAQVYPGREYSASVSLWALGESRMAGNGKGDGLMSYFPEHIKHYPNMHSVLPLHFSINRLKNGYPAHHHDYLEISYVIEGDGAERINGSRHPMKPGTLSFIQPNDIHELYTTPGSVLTLYNLRFSRELFAELESKSELRRLLVQTDSSLASAHHFAGEEEAAVRKTLDSLYEETRYNKNWKRLKIKMLLLDVLIIFDRSRKRTSAKQVGVADGRWDAGAPAGREGRVSKNVYLDVVSYIQHHFKEDLTLTAVARHFQISPGYLSMLFKKKSGRTFLQHLHDARLRHACGLLSSTEMKISDIAMESGYGSYTTFSRIFLELKGMTPSDYLKLSGGA